MLGQPASKRAEEVETVVGFKSRTGRTTAMGRSAFLSNSAVPDLCATLLSLATRRPCAIYKLQDVPELKRQQFVIGARERGLVGGLTPKQRAGRARKVLQWCLR